MCLAIYCDAGANCTESDLQTAFAANPDGAGFMYVNGGGSLVLEKFLTVDPFLKALDRAWDENPRSPFGIHFRWATHGTKGLENVHPFRVDKYTGMLHNGVLPVLMGKGSKRSDTAVFAEDYLTKLSPTWFDDPILFDMVEQYCTGSKLVVLTTHPDAEYTGYIVNEGAGHWNTANNVWYSNRSYQKSQAASAIPTWGKGKEADVVAWWEEQVDDAPLYVGAECETCGEREVMDEVCFGCGACQRCGLEVDTCDCEPYGCSVHRMTDNDIASL